MVKRLYNPKSYMADLWIFMCAQDEGGRARHPVICWHLKAPPAPLRRLVSSHFFSLHPAVFAAVFIFLLSSSGCT